MEYSIVPIQPGYFIVYDGLTKGYQACPVIGLRIDTWGVVETLIMDRDGIVGRVDPDNVVSVGFPGETLDDALIAVGIIPPDRD